MKKILSLVLVVLLSISLVACASTNNDNNSQQSTESTQAVQETKSESVSSEPINIYTLKGPTGMGMAKMISDKKDAYNFTIVSSPEEITAAVINGDADIAACPLNLASVLYNKTKKSTQLLALNTLGVTYIVTSNNVTINSIADLKGKTIASSGQGASPEYILNKLLSDNGLEVGKDVTVEYYSEHSEVASLIVSGKADIAMLPEPNVTAATAQNKDLKVALDLTKEWEKQYNDKLVQGCIVANKKFVKENTDAVNTFLSEYSQSVEFINGASEEAAQMIVDSGIMGKAALALKAIPKSHITFITGDEMKKLTTDNLTVLFDANKASVGGTMPDEDFYYTEFKQ